jgi:DNA-binding HxlR family transcriptional regulator
MNCAIAQTLERVGEWWTFLILRNAFCGMTRFDDFQRHLGIATNILSNRLYRLTEDGIFMREASKEDARSFEYKLTKKGMSLYPILIAMTEWGEKWVPHSKGARVGLLERKTGKPIKGIVVQSSGGRPLLPHEVKMSAGPGADDKIHELVNIKKSRETKNSK